MCCGGSLFNYHASSRIDVFHQVSLGASDTIRSKGLYEQQAEEVVVKVLTYRGDNGVSKSKDFKDDLARRGQTKTYYSVGEHDQNGVAERGIPIIVNSARTTMLHQALLWPENFDMGVWYFDLSYAAYLWNILPNGMNGLTPTEIYTGKKMNNKAPI